MNFAEDNEARALWQRAQLVPELRECLMHVPNGGKRNPKEAARMKCFGVRAGVSDYFLPVPRGAFHGLWLELKAGDNKPTDKQREWLNKMQAQGYAAYWATGWEESMRVFRWYLSLPVPDTDFLHPTKAAVLAGEV